MKKIFIVSILGICFTSCSSWVRIGDLNGISNRNIDDSKSYSLISRDVEYSAKAESDALEQAIDGLTKEYNGEFLRNARIYVKSNGKKVKVVADVWGIQNTNAQVNTVVKENIQLKVGDLVSFKKNGSLKEGKIIGLNSNKIIVEYGLFNSKIELNFDDVTKISK